MKFRLLKHANVSTFSGSQEALPGGGGGGGHGRPADF